MLVMHVANQSGRSDLDLFDCHLPASSTTMSRPVTAEVVALLFSTSFAMQLPSRVYHASERSLALVILELFSNTSSQLGRRELGFRAHSKLIEERKLPEGIWC